MNPSTDSPPAVRLRRILVPTDLSVASLQAWPCAISLARQFGAKLSVVHVVPTTVPAELSHIGIVLDEKRAVAEATAALDRLRRQELPPDLEVDLEVLTGSPHYRLCEAARSLQAEMIILATHGHTGLAHIWLGSTAERVVRHAPCPVLTVRESWMAVKLPTESPVAFKRILAPTDLSNASRKALCYAAAFARQFGGTARLLHVIEPPPYPEFGYAYVPAKEARLRQVAWEKLEELRNQPPLSEVPDTSAAVRSGNTLHEIVSEAAEQKAELIVLTTQGHTGLVHMLLGSTAEKVVRHAPCPVLVVREKEQEFVPV